MRTAWRSRARTVRHPRRWRRARGSSRPAFDPTAGATRWSSLPARDRAICCAGSSTQARRSCGSNAASPPCTRSSSTTSEGTTRRSPPARPDMARMPWVVVARREYAEGARSKWFVFMCLLGPVLFGAIIGFSVWAQLRGAGKTARLVLVDGTREEIGAQIAAKLEAGKLGEGQRFTVELARSPTDDGALTRRIDAGDLDGYLVLPADATAGGLVVYRGTNASSNIDMAILEHSLRTAIVDVRAHVLGLSDAQTTALLAPVSFDARQPTANGREVNGGAAFAVAYVVSLLLYIGILLYGVTVMRSVILEKSSRVMEVVVSCARPWDL